MSGTVRWLVAVLVTVAAFGLSLWVCGALLLPLWLKSGADRWAVAARWARRSRPWPRRGARPGPDELRTHRLVPRDGRFLRAVGSAGSPRPVMAL